MKNLFRIQNLVLAGAVFALTAMNPATAQQRPARVRAADQDTTARQERVEARAQRMQDRGRVADGSGRVDPARQTVLTLARRLELDDRQVNALRVAVEGADDRSGAGWRIAALLQQELTPTQKDQLFDMASRASAFRAGRQMGLAERDARAGRGFVRSVRVTHGRTGREVVRSGAQGGVRGGRGIGRGIAPGAGQGAARGVRQGPANGDRLEAMAEALRLTDAQKELMRIHGALVSLNAARAGIASGAGTSVRSQPGNRARISSR